MSWRLISIPRSSNGSVAYDRFAARRESSVSAGTLVAVVSSELAKSRSRIGGEPAIECEVTPRRSLPAEFAIHCPQLNLAQQQRLCIEGESAIETIEHRRSARFPERKSGGVSGSNAPLGRVNDGIGQAPDMSYDRSRAVAHRIKRGQPAWLEAAWVKQQVCAGVKAMRKLLVITDPDRQTAWIVLHHIGQLDFERRIALAQHDKVNVALEYRRQSVANDIRHLLIGDPADQAISGMVGAISSPTSRCNSALQIRLPERSRLSNLAGRCRSVPGFQRR